MKRKKVFLMLILWILFVVSCNKNITKEDIHTVDAVLIGAGIMSATIGSILKELNNEINIVVFEKLDNIGLESSSAWNNAGTGHAALCELNYTPMVNGVVDIKKAISINKSFEISKQFWAYLAKKYNDFSPESFLHRVAHISFVWGDDNTNFLKKRFDALKVHPFFSDMNYSEDPKQIQLWAPLLMKDRKNEEKVAATHVHSGTDVDFGNLSKNLFAQMSKHKNYHLHLGHEVIDIKPQGSKWLVKVKKTKDSSVAYYETNFVFVGAGGGALKLLQYSGIPEIKGYAGFPVGGQWLVSDNTQLADSHLAKVYGKASLKAPPMSVPHLDTRIIDGKKYLLFGPFATFSTKFLKEGSFFDLFSSINFGNLIPLLDVGIHNLDLTKYLIGQLLLSNEERLASLKEYMPSAKLEDWRFMQAGQRVQVIKPTNKGAVLEFGTEVISNKEGTIIGLLGASPGASIAVQIALDVLQKAFPQQISSHEWHSKLKAMLPFYYQDPLTDLSYYRLVKSNTDKVLKLN